MKKKKKKANRGENRYKTKGSMAALQRLIPELVSILIC